MVTPPPRRAGGWSGDLRIGRGWALWRGAIGDGEAHRHFAAQAVFAPEPVTVLDAGGRKASSRCLLIDPLVSHRLAPAPDAELLYVEPSRRWPFDIKDRLARVRSEPAVVILRHSETAGFWTRQLVDFEDARPLDPRIDRAVEAVEREFPDVPAVADAALGSGLSVDRFRHLFAEEIGLTYGRYILWARLRRAATELLSGYDVTTAAHAAGFADAAHFARTLKATFGVTATQALRPSGADKENAFSTS